MPETGIAREEYLGRLGGAQKLMAESGLDGLLIGNGANFNYFTGIHMRVHNSRPSLLVLGQSGPPAMILHTARNEWRLDRPARAPWIEDVRFYPEMSDIPVETIVEVLADMGLAHGTRVGAEIGAEFYLHMTIANFIKLQERLPQAKLEDASQLIWRLRSVKSPAEIALVREACDVAARAYDQLFSSRLEGLTEKQVLGLSKKAQIDHGADETGASIDNPRLTWGQGPRAESDLLFRKGDMVWLDTMPAVGGYRADFSRAGVIGGPSQTQRDLQERVHAVTMMGVEMMKPGVRVADIAQRVNSRLAEVAARCNVASITSDLAGRIGHSMGLWTTELPSIVENDPAMLEANMVMTMEPGLATSDGKYHIEQNVLITESGHELLSTCDWRLRNLE